MRPNTPTPIRLRLAGALIAALALPALAGPALADAVRPLTGDALRETITDSTIEGSMLDGTAYSEYYDPDGTIRGEGYEGSYSFEGDEMCFAYPETDPACFGVGLDAEGKVIWLENGQVAGDGIASPGNKNAW